MGFHYKNFIAVVIVCGAAFGGFFSFVYSAEQAKDQAKNEEEVPILEKQIVLSAPIAPALTTIISPVTTPPVQTV